MMTDSYVQGYDGPASKLLTHDLPVGEQPEEWFDYVGHYGLSKDDIPLLIRLAGGDGIDASVATQAYAPFHACRALGQLGDGSAASFLVMLVEDDASGLKDSIFLALSLLGPSSLQALARRFEAPETDEWTQATILEGFDVFAQRNPQDRTRCVAFLAEALANSEKYPTLVNGFLVYHLVQLQAVEAKGVIEQAFKTGRVDEDVIGYWSDVQVELGLASVTDFAPGELFYPEEKGGLEAVERPDTTQTVSSQRSHAAETETASSYSITQYIKSA